MKNAIELHEAYRSGDVDAVRALLGDPPDFPNCEGPAGMGEIPLEYAIYHSPLPMIRKLLELGANPNYTGSGGFPSVIAAISSEREDTLTLMEMLLDFGADLEQRGVNHYTPLHLAAANNNLSAVNFLLAKGAGARARTEIDDDNTPAEEAELLGAHDSAKRLREWERLGH